METPRVTDAGFWQGDAPRIMEPGCVGLARWAADQPELAGHVLFLTSGSSGAAKWMALSRGALRASAEAVNAHLRVSRDDVWGLALPDRHVGGFGVLARGFFAGVEVARFAGKWDPRGFHGWLEEAGVSLVTLVPTQLVDLLAAGLGAPRRLRAVVVGGGPVSGELGQAARALGWPVLASFGMTEAGSQIATAPLDQLGEVFSPAPLPLLPLWQARVDGDGMLGLRGGGLFSGVILETRGIWQFVPRTGEWFATSDRALVDSAGLTPLGRADRRVKVLGELVDIDAIEHAIAQSAPELSDVWKIIDLPDPRRGCRLVLVTESVPASAAMLSALAAYQATAAGPARVAGTAVVTAFPRGELGKLRMADLRRMINAFE